MKTINEIVREEIEKFDKYCTSEKSLLFESKWHIPCLEAGEIIYSSNISLLQAVIDMVGERIEEVYSWIDEPEIEKSTRLKELNILRNQLQSHLTNLKEK